MGAWWRSAALNAARSGHGEPRSPRPSASTRSRPTHVALSGFDWSPAVSLTLRRAQRGIDRAGARGREPRSAYHGRMRSQQNSAEGGSDVAAATLALADYYAATGRLGGGRDLAAQADATFVPASLQTRGGQLARGKQSDALATIGADQRDPANAVGRLARARLLANGGHFERLSRTPARPRQPTSPARRRSE